MIREWKWDEIYLCSDKSQDTLSPFFYLCLSVRYPGSRAVAYCPLPTTYCSFCLCTSYPWPSASIYCYLPALPLPSPCRQLTTDGSLCTLFKYPTQGATLSHFLVPYLLNTCVYSLRPSFARASDVWALLGV